MRPLVQVNPKHSSVTIVGAGLAGSEAAWQLAQAGVRVELFEMRPKKSTPAHRTGKFAELVCSNSFGSDTPHSASWLLKRELEQLGAFVLAVAKETRVPAGGSLAMDRERFSQAITETLSRHPCIRIHRTEFTIIDPNTLTLICTGPLTSPALAENISALLGSHSIYFYDAISPIVSADSLDFSKMFFANRYNKGETKDFLNIPLTQEQYLHFVKELLAGDVVLPHDFEKEKYFEACLPIEVIAARGEKSLAFGPMKPVGLWDPNSTARPFAVVQLRTENIHRTAYNLVGFQTKLKYQEQQRIFRMLPGLENAEFLRLGSLHRNTFIHSPRHLLPTLQLRNHPNTFMAGQLTGTEGYLESTLTGRLAAKNILARIFDHPPWIPPAETMMGALISTITDRARVDFQPVNANFGILPPLSEKVKDRSTRNQKMAERALSKLRLLIGGRDALHFGEDASKSASALFRGSVIVPGVRIHDGT